MNSVQTSFAFDAAHFLQGHQGKCRQLHGHRWTVKVEVTSPWAQDGKLTGALISEGVSRGMIIDFTDLKSACKKVENVFDHTFILEEDSIPLDLQVELRSCGFVLTLLKCRPTAENLARIIADMLQENLGNRCLVTCVEVAETPNNIAIYRREENEL